VLNDAARENQTSMPAGELIVIQPVSTLPTRRGWADRSRSRSQEPSHWSDVFDASSHLRTTTLLLWFLWHVCIRALCDCAC
jgi:hypothetical protein